MIVSCPSLTLACPFIGEQFVALLTAAFEGAHRVPTEVITASVVLLAFVDVWDGENKRKENRKAVGKSTSLCQTSTHDQCVHLIDNDIAAVVVEPVHVQNCTPMHIQHLTSGTAPDSSMQKHKNSIFTVNLYQIYKRQQGRKPSSGLSFNLFKALGEKVFPGRHVGWWDGFPYAVYLCVSVHKHKPYFKP